MVFILLKLFLNRVENSRVGMIIPDRIFVKSDHNYVEFSIRITIQNSILQAQYF